MLLQGINEVKQFIKDNGIQYFRAEEFVCPCCNQVKIDSELILKLEDLRHLFDRPIKITSAYRCPKHNKAIGGVKNSEHIFGEAVDIYIDNSKDRYKIIDIIFSFGVDFKRIGIAHNFIHLGISQKHPQELQAAKEQ